ncbi:MAG: hypothetical protein F6K10_27515 [Moorea sp. SIO2B7]|nr:hypothetical protein [Moorena sp. SIO2B7]
MEITVMVYHCQQNLINPEPELKAVLEFICEEANKLTNCAIYLCRQLFFKARKFLTSYDLDKKLKRNKHLKALRSCAAQQALHKVAESFKSYQKLWKLFKDELLHFFPKPPNYRKKGGLAPVIYPAKFLSLTQWGIRFSLGRQVKAWFRLDAFYLKMLNGLSDKLSHKGRMINRHFFKATLIL